MTAPNVKVKPLVWDEHEGYPDQFFAQADTGVYRVVAPNGRGLWMWMRYSWWPRSGCLLGEGGNTIDTGFDTPEAAKAAAQADHEARILSAIDTTDLDAKLREARVEGMQAARAVVAARHMGDNTREDLEVMRCVSAIDALIEKEVGDD